jgi:hypothetical protein
MITFPGVITRMGFAGGSWAEMLTKGRAEMAVKGRAREARRKRQGFMI